MEAYAIRMENEDPLGSSFLLDVSNLEVLAKRRSSLARLFNSGTTVKHLPFSTAPHLSGALGLN